MDDYNPTEGERVESPEEKARRLEHLREEYAAGKKTLDSRIIEAENWWKKRHWASIRGERVPGEPEPSTGWLVNVILSKHSDAVDAYPEPVCLAREESDEPEAKMLSSILPVVLQRNDFEKTWSDVWWYKLKAGTGVYGVFWDSHKDNGLGDIKVCKVDILNLFWEPGVSDIQDSPFVFCVAAVDNSKLEAMYPQLKGKLGKSQLKRVQSYHYDDKVKTDDKSLVVDCYHKVDGAVHLVTYVNEEILVDTENTGVPLYNHGKYPFVFDSLFPEEGYPNCGYGYVDMCKDTQRLIDIINNAIAQNTIAAATPRWFVRQDGGVNEAEYADLTKKFVHVSGRIDEDSVKQIVTQAVPSQVITYVEMLISEMKETSGNRDVNNGGTSSSVTAASAIAALQEAGNGLSRDMISASYRAFRNVVELCIELIRQFYNLPRKFRIAGEAGAMQYVMYSNAGLQAQTEIIPGGGISTRQPIIDIEIEVQAEAEYSKQAQNQLAIQLYQLGIFNPAMASQAAPMIEMMDFKGKDKVLQQVMAGQQMFMQQQMLMQAAPTAPQTDSGGESSRVERARENARGGAMPR